MIVLSFDLRNLEGVLKGKKSIKDNTLSKEIIPEEGISAPVEVSLQVRIEDEILKPKPKRVIDIDSLPDELQEVYRELLMPVKTDISFDKVILSKENHEKVIEFLKENECRETLVEYGLKPMNRLLFFGASGFGKTFLARVLSNHMGYTMLYVDIAQALSEGRVAKNISSVFRLANYLKKSFVFMDEVDSIAWNRDSSKGDSADMRRATNSLFQNVDQMDESNVFVSATNMINRLDEAFVRRFDMRFEFKAEYIDIVEAIRKFMFSKFRLLNDIDENGKMVMHRMLRLSYAEIDEITQRHMKRAILGGTDLIKVSDIFEDMAIGMRVNVNIPGMLKEDGEILFPL